MANIPVERKAGTPWWVWLLGLLLLLGLIFLLLSLFGDDDDEVAEVDPVETVEPVAPVATAGGLSSLYVTRVTGDRTFYVAPSATETGQETLVVLDEEPSPGVAGIEGQVDVNQGQTVDLSGGTRTALNAFDYNTMGLAEADLAELNRLDPATEVIRIAGANVEISGAELENVEVEQ